MEATTVGELFEILRKMQPDLNVMAYEGEVTGIRISSEGKQIYFINTPKVCPECGQIKR